MNRSGQILRNATYENDSGVVATVVEQHGSRVYAAIESSVSRSVTKLARRRKPILAKRRVMLG